MKGMERVTSRGVDVVRLRADRSRETRMKDVNGALRWALCATHNPYYVMFRLCHIAR